MAFFFYLSATNTHSYMYVYRQFIYCFFIVFSFSLPSFSQQIPASRITDWSNPGCQSYYVPSHTINISDFNADASGAIAADSSFQAALSSVSGPKKIYFSAGTYLFNQPLVLSDSITLEGEADGVTLKSLVLFKFAPGIDKHGILVQGSETSLGINAGGDLQQGDLKIYAPNVNLMAGDYIRLFAMDDSSYITSYAWASHSTGQIFKIEQLDGDSLLLNKPLRRNYSATKPPIIFQLNPTKQVHIKCINFERIEETPYQTSNVYFNNAADCSVSGVESYNTNFAHITINKSCGITVSNSYFHDAFAYGDGGVGYGVVLQYTASDCYVYSNVFNHLRHSMLLQSGANGNVLAYNFSSNPYWTTTGLPSNSAGDIVLHGNYPYMNLLEGNVIQNIVIDNSHGINGPFNTFFRNRAELYGVFMNSSPASSQQNFMGNQITNNGFLLGLYSLQGSDHYQYGNSIRGTITPSGTSEYSDSTLFGFNFTDFYRYHSTVPPIKLDNWQSLQSFVQAQSRASGNQKSICSDMEYENPYLSIHEGTKSAIQIFPNPSTGIFYVKGEGISSVEIFDMTGKKYRTVYQSNQVDLSNFPNGMYWVKIKIGQAEFINKVSVMGF